MSSSDYIVRPREAEPEHRRYDFERPLAFTPRQIRRVVEHHETFAGTLAVALSAQLGEPVQVTCTSTDEVQGGDFVRSREVPTVLYQGTIGRQSVLGLDVSPSLALFLVERALGGNDSLKDQSRKLSALETRVMTRQALPVLAESLSTAWEDAPVQFTDHDSDPRRLQIVEPEEPTVVAVFDVTSGEGAASLTLCYPAGTLRALLSDAPAREVAQPPTLLDVPLDIRADFGQARVSVGELLSLTPGDVIPLSRTPDEPLLVWAGDHLQFRAIPGTEGGRLALQLVSVPVSAASKP